MLRSIRTLRRNLAAACRLPPNAQVLRYRHSLIYAYEFNESGETIDRPTSILPLSVVELKYNKPGYVKSSKNIVLNTRKVCSPDLLNLTSLRVATSVVWNGTLSLQSHSIKHVAMHSHFQNVGRPRGL